jgi:serine/threonine protein kinase
VSPHAPSVETVLAEAVGIPDPAARAAYLDRACGDDGGLRARVERLVADHFRAGNFLERPPLAALPDETAPFEPGGGAAAVGTRVGPYALRELLGEGGMGAVYLAEQSEPVKRRVALKVVKPGMDSRQVVARFAAERQALALMDHPNIARILDGGTTEAGRPYFVMELVRGIPVTDYCDQAGLSTRERLRLFVRVCRAVQHAHQKGVIHRDLKPSNVLVTVIDGRPVPKVIDFGIAKATGGALTDRTLQTGFHQLVGTPLYMAPEQAELSGVDVDTRADVYSLGVLLYELLTGATPFDPHVLRKAGFDEMRRMIREDEPAKPSKRLSTLAAEQASTVGDRRGVDPRRLGRQVRGELDMVVMRCLDKDRTRRYQSPAELADDVERHLDGRPVEAVPPSAWYRVRKFARRNRGPVVAGGLVLAALVAGVVGTSVGLAEAHQARRNAEQAEAEAKADRDDAKALADFLLDQFLHPAMSHRAMADRSWGDTVAVNSEDRESDDRPLSQALDISDERMSRIFGGRPRAEATARHSIGVAWRGLGRWADAEPHLRRAVELREREFGPEHPITLRSLTCLGEVLASGGRGGDAVGVLERVRSAEARAPGPGPHPHPSTVHLLAKAHQASGDLPTAIRLMEGVRDRGPVVPPGLMRDLAAAYRAAGRPADATRLWADVAPAVQARVGVGSVHGLYLTDAWVGDLLADGQPDRAVEVSREYLAGVRSGTPDGGPDGGVAMGAIELYSSTLLAAGRPAEAEPVLREVLALYDRRVEPSVRLERSVEDAGWTRAMFRSRIGGALLGQGKYAEAEPLLVEGYEGMRDQQSVVPPGSRDPLPEAADRLVRLYTALGKPDEAAKWRAERAKYRGPASPPRLVR